MLTLSSKVYFIIFIEKQKKSKLTNNIVNIEKTKRKFDSTVTLSDEDSNDCKIIKRSRTSLRINSSGENSCSNLNEIYDQEDEFSGQIVNDEAKKIEKKIVMKLIRKENSQNFMSVSCSEDDITKPNDKEETLLKVAAVSSDSKINTILAEEIKTKNNELVSSKPKVIPARGKDFNLLLAKAQKPSPNDETNASKRGSSIEIASDKRKSLSKPEVSQSSITITSKPNSQAPQLVSSKSQVLKTSTLLTAKPTSPSKVISETEKSKKIKSKVNKLTGTASASNLTKLPLQEKSAIANTSKSAKPSLNEKSTTNERFKIPKNQDLIPSTVLPVAPTTVTSSVKASTSKTSTIDKPKEIVPKNNTTSLPSQILKSKKPIKNTNRNSSNQVPASPKKTRQRTQLQQQKESENKKNKLNSNNNNNSKNNNMNSNSVCVKTQIGLEAIFGKTYKTLDEIHVDINTFNLINANAFNNRKFDYGLSYLSLSDNEKMHLLKLMRRKQFVNTYELLANEFNKKFDNGDIVINESNMRLNPYLDDSENFIINQIRTLNFTETMVVYKRFKNLLNSPFRTIDVFDDGERSFLIFFFSIFFFNSYFYTKMEASLFNVIFLVY